MREINFKFKYYFRLVDGKKIPRKVKKKILGCKMSKSALKRRISAVKITENIRTIYDGFGLSDAFCPKCGCDDYRSSGNRADYPELWESFYCLRCGHKVAEADNSPYYHVLYEDIREKEYAASASEEFDSQFDDDLLGGTSDVG